MDAASKAGSEPQSPKNSAPDHPPEHKAEGAGPHAQSFLALTALGVVFGDIGTSPLYTFSTALTATGQAPGPTQVLGIVSLTFWALMLIISVKYVGLVLRADNDGEGGILALLSLVEHRDATGQRAKFSIVILLGVIGAALLYGMRRALHEGFSHALTMDSDGQHPGEMIPAFMAASQAAPGSMVLGEPQFDASAPSLRVKGRRISNWWANLETLWTGVHDSLYGFRVYPIAPLVAIMNRQLWMRRFDFDVEAAVRLCWRGVRPINMPAPVRYFRVDEGGVSHFRYVRDNALLSWMHLRLLAGFVLRLPLLASRRWRSG